MNSRRRALETGWADGLTRANSAQGGEIRAAYGRWSAPDRAEIEGLNTRLISAKVEYERAQVALEVLRNLQNEYRTEVTKEQLSLLQRIKKGHAEIAILTHDLEKQKKGGGAAQVQELTRSLESANAEVENLKKDLEAAAEDAQNTLQIFTSRKRHRTQRLENYEKSQKNPALDKRLNEQKATAALSDEAALMVIKQILDEFSDEQWSIPESRKTIFYDVVQQLVARGVLTYDQTILPANMNIIMTAIDDYFRTNKEKELESATAAQKAGFYKKTGFRPAGTIKGSDQETQGDQEMQGMLKKFSISSRYALPRRKARPRRPRVADVGADYPLTDYHRYHRRNPPRRKPPPPRRPRIVDVGADYSMHSLDLNA